MRAYSRALMNFDYADARIMKRIHYNYARTSAAETRGDVAVEKFPTAIDCDVNCVIKRYFNANPLAVIFDDGGTFPVRVKFA